MSGKSWLLPEFALVTHAHNKTMKKLKAKSKITPDLRNIVTSTEYQAALQKGYEEGKANGMLEVKGLLNQLSSLLEKLSMLYTEERTLFKKSHFKIIKACCESIIAKEIDLNPEIILSMIEKGLDQIEAEGLIKIICGSKLISLLNNLDYSRNASLIIELDARVTDYSFKIESQKQLLGLTFSDIINGYLENK